MLLADLPPDLPLLLLATAEAELKDIPEEALALFGNSQGSEHTFEMTPLDNEQRRLMFAQVCKEIAGPAHEKPTTVLSQPPPEVSLMTVSSTQKQREKREWGPAGILHVA